MQSLKRLCQEVHLFPEEALVGSAMLLWEECSYLHCVKCMRVGAEAALPTHTRYTIHLKHITDDAWDIRWQSLPQTYGRFSPWHEGVVEEFPPPAGTPMDLYGYFLVGFCTTPLVRRIFHMGDPQQAAQFHARFAEAAAAGA